MSATTTTTFADIILLANTLYSPYVDNGFVDATSGTPTELALLLRLANNRIAAKPQDYYFSKKTSTISLASGQLTYNLKDYLPDFKSLYQLSGVNQNQEHPFRPNYEANIIPATGYSMRGTIIYFTGNVPANGTFTVQYKSKWMVEDANGNRKLDFIDQTDVSVLDDNDINVLIWMLGEFVHWKADVASQEKKKEIKAWLAEALTDLQLHNENTNQTHYML